MKIKGDNNEWCEICGDKVTREEALPIHKKYRDRDAGWADTRIVKKKNGKYTVIQRNAYGRD